MNIDNLTFNVPCPKCSFENQITLKQVRLEETIFCSGCVQYEKRGLQGYYACFVRSTSFAIGTVVLTESIPALRLSMVL